MERRVLRDHFSCRPIERVTPPTYRLRSEVVASRDYHARMHPNGLDMLGKRRILDLAKRAQPSC